MIPAPTNRIRSLAVETVTTLEADGGYLSIALDGQGQPHVAYWSNFHSSQGRLFYAVRAGSGWQQEEVAVTQGAQTALALDANGAPLLAYLDLSAAALKVARQTTAGWQSETVATGLNSFAPGALTLTGDSAAQPVITYFDTDQLKLARFTAGGWQSEIIDSELGSGYYHDVAQASNGDLMVASANLTSQTVRLWRVTQAGISGPEPIELPPGAYDFLTLTLDDHDRPHLGYVAPGGLTHAFLADTGWQTELIKTGADVGLYARLKAHDTQLKVAYYNANDGTMLIARRRNNVWLEEHGDGGPDQDVGGYAALAIDALGTAHVVYYDWDNQAVKYVRDNTPPVAANNHFKTLVNKAVSGNILANDSDPEEDPLQATPQAVANPRHGQVTLNTAGDVTYVPEEGFHGQDSFRYEVCDDRGLCTTATVTISVEVPVRIFIERTDNLFTRENMSKITLRLTDGRPDTWAGLLFKNAAAEWESVKESPNSPNVGWHGTRDSEPGRPWEQSWSVDPGRFGQGPFRWAVYSRKDGYHLVYSEEFFLLGNKQVLILSGTIK